MKQFKRSLVAWLAAGVFGSMWGCGPTYPSTEVEALESESPINFLRFSRRATLPQDPLLPLRMEKPPVPVLPEKCDSFYDDNVLRDVFIEIEPSAWKGLQREHDNNTSRRDDHYFPLIAFKSMGRVSTEAMIRLRGNPAGRDNQEKMQFQISFNEINPDGRFKGMRKVLLDAPYYNPSMLHDRLAMSVMRDVGVPAPCVNHARLYVNGKYYGLFTNLEKIDREFLERNFADPNGNLWKGDNDGYELKTNEDENPDTSAARRFQRLGRGDFEKFDEMTDLETAVRAWAVEAFLPDEDGYWAGGLNYYWYEDPQKGFTYLPWDIDLGFTRLSTRTDPLTWDKSQRDKNADKFHEHPHVDLALEHPTWRKKFINDIQHVMQKVPVRELQARIDRWAAQIADAVQEDPNAPWSFREHQKAVQELRDYVELRTDRLASWAKCTIANELSSSGCM